MTLLPVVLLHPAYSPFTVVALVVLAHVAPYLADAFGYNKQPSIPGPWLAKFSDAWLGWVAAQGSRSEVVHQQHLKYGKFVRIAPNHISIADPDALQIVYAHGNGSLKSNFYDAFVSIRRGLFNTRDRAEHTRKRKIVSHIFSQKNVLEFEPYVRSYIEQLTNVWDNMYTDSLKGKLHDGCESKNGRVWFDCLNWYNYLAFDIIGDLAFGTPFGMIEAGKDAAPIAEIGQSDKAQVKYVPAIKTLNDRGDFSASMGVLPPWIRPYVKRIPWYSKGNQAVANLAGIAVAAVNKRLAEPTDRNDLLTRLQQGKDENGQPMCKEELTAEALTQLIAGSDTTSNSSCAITYYLAKNPRAQEKLQRELDDALGSIDDTAGSATSYEQVKRLRYLDACINEGLRLHSTSSMGLPRIVPAGGLEVSGRFFPPGSVLSVPSYTIHRDPEVWGEDVEEYRPERWLVEDDTMIQKTFNPFSFGPRACVGRNLASMELLIIISSIVRRYDIVLKDPNAKLETREGFLRKPLDCYIGLKRREV
ncbi:hypothetical protein BOTBODRAFT_27392 [Botryobasidium botryosum FD-172 SS1]|uniref:Cytochrome P450 monooxygenase n=1 Tax=Botryobasidium botryosum (strain FD-172 SS1) TaxID=930990 RepID=A0A067MZ59_BOTB1|nr:hypothetical protein BOTBODRAFT_27392 [Botryobasidium botryosum FD-172 SS1]